MVSVLTGTLLLILLTLMTKDCNTFLQVTCSSTILYVSTSSFRILYSFRHGIEAQRSCARQTRWVLTMLFRSCSPVLIKRNSVHYTGFGVNRKYKRLVAIFHIF